jgi:hypothetical protein
MVRNAPISARIYDTPWETHEALVEQYYPQQLSWYAAEGPQGRREELARVVREKPLKAVGIAFLVGLAVAVLGAPAVRMGTGMGGIMARRSRVKARRRRNCRTA